MGVVGAGKTTVGRLLAAELGWEFADADDFHPESNVEKIRRGIGLGDDDREPWLLRVRDQVVRWIEEGRNGVLACSALKRRYRDVLAVGPGVVFVHLKGDRALIAGRLRARTGHFAGESILESQLADLEEPAEATVVDLGLSPERIVAQIRDRLRLP